MAPAGGVPAGQAEPKAPHTGEANGPFLHVDPKVAAKINRAKRGAGGKVYIEVAARLSESGDTVIGVEISAADWCRIVHAVSKDGANYDTVSAIHG